MYVSYKHCHPPIIIPPNDVIDDHHSSTPHAQNAKSRQFEILDSLKQLAVMEIDFQTLRVCHDTNNKNAQWFHSHSTRMNKRHR